MSKYFLLPIIVITCLVAPSAQFGNTSVWDDSVDPKNTSGRGDDYCEDTYEYDQAGCNADSQCEWDDEDYECDDYDDDSDDSDSSDSSDSSSSGGSNQNGGSGGSNNGGTQPVDTDGDGTPDDADDDDDDDGVNDPVSYTHLTLPTILLV